MHVNFIGVTALPQAREFGRAEAERFILALRGRIDQPIRWQTFDDSELKRSWFALARRATLAEFCPAISAFQTEGRGIFFAVNGMKGEGRSNANFTHALCVFADDDTRREGPRAEWRLAPHIIVESSPGKYHYYWLTSTDDGPAWVAVMKRIAALYGTDKSVCDLARVMRLPGSLHLKDPASPHRVRVCYLSNAPRYTWAEVEEAFPPLAAVSPAPPPARPPSSMPPMGTTFRGDRFEIGAAVETVVSGAPGVHDAITRTAAHFASIGMARENAEALLSALLRSGDDGTPRMAGHLADMPRAVDSAYAKFYFPDSPADLSQEPLDLFASSESRPAFDPRDYPPLIANLAADIARRMGCDPLVPAWTALVAAGTLIDDSISTQVKAKDTTWCESSRLWVAVLGPPSTKKSPPIAAVLAPVNKLEAGLWATYKVQLRAWEFAAAAAKKVGGPEPERPQLERVTVGDATTEALCNVLEHNPAGVLAVHDELTGFFGAMDAYRPQGASKDRAIYLTAYNGGAYTVDRVGKGP